MAAALLAYDATVRTNLRPALTIEQLLGDGSNGAADHALNVGEMIEAVELPPPLAGERAAYKRAIGRAYAEWPLVEVVARVVVTDGAFRLARLTAGGVAPVPIRLHAARGGGAKRARFGRDHCGCGARRDARRAALADDGLQARAFVRPRAGLAGAVHGLSGRRGSRLVDFNLPSDDAGQSHPLRQPARKPLVS